MRLLNLTWCFTLACSSASSAAEPKPTPVTKSAASTDAAWIDTAIEEALDAELMPGTSGGPDPSRKDALRAFFKAHPEYKQPDRRALLWEHACGLDGTEAAHAFITEPPPKTPVQIEVKTDDWGVLVAHASGHCTSDDWSHYSYEASEAARALGVTTAYGNPKNDALIIRRDGKELHRIKLEGQGFIAVRAGKAPMPMMYDPGISGEVKRFFSDGK